MTQERLTRTVEEYLIEVLALVEPLPAETVPLADSAGRTLAAPVTSRGPVPAFANSAMDGFAVRHADLSVGVRLIEVADVPAGSADDPRIGAGECARIMTGAPVPTDADTIVPRELVTETTEGIVINEFPAAGTHVRHAGEDLAAGEEILPAGRLLDARALSLVAACGRAHVEVTRRPVVNVASTGDELVKPGGDLTRGQIYESNSAFLAHAARRDGADVQHSVTAPDNAAAFAATLDDLAASADLIVLTGGVSVGDYDVVRIVLAERADAQLRAVTMQPGKPQCHAVWRTADGRAVPIIALPGNPLSAAISYELFVAPVIDKLLARTDRRPDAPAVVATGWRSPAGRRQIVPVSLEVDAAGVRRISLAHRRGSQSHMVSALALADALAFVPADMTEVRAGDVLLVRSLA